MDLGNKRNSSPDMAKFLKQLNVYVAAILIRKQKNCKNTCTLSTYENNLVFSLEYLRFLV